MALVQLEHPVREIHGALEKQGIINRRKKYRDDDGRIIHEGRQEAYKVANPRNWKKKPAKGAELAQQNFWRKACHRTTQILQAAQPDGPSEIDLACRRLNHIPDYYTPEEARDLYQEYKLRFQAQLPNKRGTRPDPQAPVDKTTHSPKRYSHFPSFVRTLIYYSLK